MGSKLAAGSLVGWALNTRLLRWHVWSGLPPRSVITYSSSGVDVVENEYWVGGGCFAQWRGALCPPRLRETHPRLREPCLD